jgi:hypothetical protein
MNINELWEQAESNPGTEIKLGSTVFCDACGKDFTDSTESGGFIFGSKAYCPECAVKTIGSIRSYGEEHLIRSRCPEGASFADFVREYRGEDATICVERFTIPTHRNLF